MAMGEPMLGFSRSFVTSNEYCLSSGKVLTRNLSCSLDELYISPASSPSPSLAENMWKRQKREYKMKRRTYSPPVDIHKLRVPVQETERIFSTWSSSESVNSDVEVQNGIPHNEFSKKDKFDQKDFYLTKFSAMSYTSSTTTVRKKAFASKELDSGKQKSHLKTGAKEKFNGLKSPSPLVVEQEIHIAEHKKMVRFADACGRALAEVKSFKLVSHLDLSVNDSSTNFQSLLANMSAETHLLPLFILPVSPFELARLAQDKKVKLECANVFGTKILGSVLVANISFSKCVDLRVSTNNWTSFETIQMSYVSSVNDGSLDRFCFEVVIDPARVLDKVEFCIQYKSDVGEFWDNNCGLNYILKLVQN